jgi:putative two-component system response regulator
MRVLIVDDDPVTIEIVGEDLRHFGYDVTSAASGSEAFDLIRTGRYPARRFRLADARPQRPGTVPRSAQTDSYGYIYFILLTSNTGLENVLAGLDAGADDFLTKPFQPQELVMRLRTGERILGLESRDLLIFAMAKLAESRDNETGMHLERMREYSKMLAEELSTWPRYAEAIDGDYVQLLYLTSPLHDIGKVAIPDSVLLKPGRLTRDEFEVMKKHTLLGGETLKSVAQLRPEAHFLTMAEEIALTHHEHYNGAGYPLGLAGDAIPLCGRIVAVADVYDALTSRRVYKPAYSHDMARTIILEGSGTQFDPDVVRRFSTANRTFCGWAITFAVGNLPQPVRPPPRRVEPRPEAVATSAHRPLAGRRTPQSLPARHSLPSRMRAILPSVATVSCGPMWQADAIEGGFLLPCNCQRTADALRPFSGGGRMRGSSAALCLGRWRDSQWNLAPLAVARRHEPGPLRQRRHSARQPGGDGQHRRGGPDRPGRSR